MWVRLLMWVKIVTTIHVKPFGDGSVLLWCKITVCKRIYTATMQNLQVTDQSFKYHLFNLRNVLH